MHSVQLHSITNERQVVSIKYTDFFTALLLIGYFSEFSFDKHQYSHTIRELIFWKESSVFPKGLRSLTHTQEDENLLCENKKIQPSTKLKKSLARQKHRIIRLSREPNPIPCQWNQGYSFLSPSGERKEYKRNLYWNDEMCVKTAYRSEV